MKYTKFGNSDLNVSRICMGCMGLQVSWRRIKELMHPKNIFGLQEHRK